MSADIPLAEKGAFASSEVDPAISHALNYDTYENGTAAPSVPNGTAIHSFEHTAADVPVTTTTTTIITSTTGPAHPESGFVGTSLPAPLGSSGAATEPLEEPSAATDGTTNDLVVPTTTVADASHAPATVPVAASANGAVVPAAAAATTAGVVGAAAVAEKKTEPKSEIPPVMAHKDVKKYSKLLKKEAKSDEKELSAAIKAAHSDEKAARKAKKAEQQSIKRHHDAVADEHKYTKALNKANLEREKAAATLQKAVEELDIKKRHSATTSEAFENTKKRIESLRSQKIRNDQDRARRNLSISQATTA